MTGRLMVRGIPCHGTNLITWLAVPFVLALGSCGKETTPTTTPGNAADSEAAANPASAAKQVDHKYPVVRIETNQGAITLRLDAVKAPGTVRNFLNYAGEGFYDNTLVHYVDAGKMILAGGYAVDGQPKPTRPPIRNKAHNGLKNVRGTIAMARDQAMVDN